MQRRIPRLAAGLVAAAGVLALTACGSGFSGSSSSSSSGAAGGLTSSKSALTVLIGSSGDAETAAVKSAVIRCARRTIALVDASKFGTEAFIRFAALTTLDVLITDRAPDDDLAAALDAAGVEVVVA